MRKELESNVHDEVALATVLLKILQVMESSIRCDTTKRRFGLRS